MKTNETGANHELADTFIRAEARRLHEAGEARRAFNERNRTDWRKTLAKRDDKREARSMRMARRSHARNSGRIGFGMVRTLATLAAAIIATPAASHVLDALIAASVGASVFLPAIVAAALVG